MKVLLVAPEVAPFSKTGGLADVVGSLPAVLESQGVEVTTISPLYRSVKRFFPRREPYRLRVQLGSETAEGAVARSGRHWFVEHDGFFDREGLYGTPQGDYGDNSRRFAFFCRGVLEFIRQQGAPDVIHAHDWPCGLIPACLRTLYARDLPAVRTVFTVHNLAYQGIFPPWDMALTGLDGSRFNSRELEFYGRVSYLKAGLVFADAVTTVSPTYAREIQTERMGCGLHGVLRERASAVHGILNGVDYVEWNPETDPLLAANYSARSLSGKAECKAALQRRCGLPVRPRVPLAGVIGRLAEQKGIGLLLRSADALVAEGLQVVLLGSGDQHLQDEVLGLSARHPGKFSVHVAFDTDLAHRIEAGCDLLLMPSLYEPCGLNQIYSLRYGTVPVVRATGGLADTVEDGRTGFVFREYSVEAFVGAVRRALAVYGDDRRWRAMMRAGMSRDFSWGASARRYRELYESLLRP